MSAPVADRVSNRFIDPKVLIRIQNMELVARSVVEGFVQGLHKSPYLGFSVDFAAYRSYFPGDSRHFVGEDREAIDHRVDGVLQLEHLALRVDDDLL